MTFKRVTPQDVEQVAAFLNAHAEHAMFPLNNLALFGLDGDNTMAPRMWMQANCAVTDVLTVTKCGMVLPYLPSGDFAGAARCLSGGAIIGINGPAQSGRGIRDAMGLTDAAMELDADEGHYALDLADLNIPDGSTRLCPADKAPLDVQIEWMMDYHINTLGMTAQAANAQVPAKTKAAVASGRRVVLMDGDVPVCTTAFNAALSDIVQIGPVYTPPQHRGHGHARRAVALHLDQARASGVARATLFTSNPSAIAAYTAIEFDRIGDWTLAILKTAQVVP